MNRLCFLLVLFLLYSSVSAAAERKPKQQSSDNHIAVFDIETGDKDLSKTITAIVTREFVKSGKYKVMDRSQMDKILGEQKFQTSGCVSGQCIVEIGQLLSVGKIVTGSITMVGTSYFLTISLINVESGQIESVAQDKCRNIEDLVDTTQKVVKQLLGEEVDPPTLGVSAGTSAGTGSAPAPQSVKDFTDPATNMEFMLVKGGCFKMGDSLGEGEDDEKPEHDVCVGDFFIGRLEVTQAQWLSIMGHNPAHFRNCGLQCPIENVSWNDVQEFIKKLNARSKGNRYRLPTEAEWEFAARERGRNVRFGNGKNNIKASEANFDPTVPPKKPYSETGEYKMKTSKAGSFRPNSLGLFDMSGNVWEWTNDWYAPDHYPTVPPGMNNPQGAAPGDSRVIRGGSWNNGSDDIRASGRCSANPDTREYSIGFRLVKVP